MEGYTWNEGDSENYGSCNPCLDSIDRCVSCTNSNWCDECEVGYGLSKDWSTCIKDIENCAVPNTMYIENLLIKSCS